jgi:molybdopterin synthase catalytic subunit
MKIELRTTAYDPFLEIRDYQAGTAFPVQFGASSTFVGTMRDFNDGEPVTSMFLEHYPGMTEQYLQRIADEATRRWEVIDLLLLHRVGEIQPADPIVTIAVWSAHRNEAFSACRYLIEELKSRAPFWKKERLQDSERWVTHNTPAD